MKRTIAIFAVVLLGLVSRPAAAGPLYLVYESGGAQDVIKQAMTDLGFSYVVRDASHPVTAADLSSGLYSALVIGWSAGGSDMTGLDTTVLADGITGNVLLTGHDADYHTAQKNPAAATFMQRAVEFAGASPGKPGILAFPVYSLTNPFFYLPTTWGVTAFDNLAAETISGITAAGGDSGLYAGLSLADLSNWGNSFHASFTAWGPALNLFEIGAGPVDPYNVTIGTTVTPLEAVPEPASLLLLATGLAGITRTWRKRRA